jgi:hypothetical protein
VQAGKLSRAIKSLSVLIDKSYHPHYNHAIS